MSPTLVRLLVLASLYHLSAFPRSNNAINYAQYFASALAGSSLHAAKYSSTPNSHSLTKWGYPLKVSGDGTLGLTVTVEAYAIFFSAFLSGSPNAA